MRPLRLVFGTLWALAMLMAGLWLYEHFGELAEGQPSSLAQLLRCAAVFAFAGSLFVFMMLVADELCPQAPVLFTAGLKAFTAALALPAMGWGFHLAWRLWLARAGTG